MPIGIASLKITGGLPEVGVGQARCTQKTQRKNKIGTGGGGPSKRGEIIERGVLRSGYVRRTFRQKTNNLTSRHALQLRKYPEKACLNVVRLSYGMVS